MRADIFLHTAGLAKSRSHAASLIRDGVTLDGRRIEKPSSDIAENTDPARICLEKPQRYVSRGGIKLEAALDAFSLSATGRTAVDIGASTGGFTDCLLQHGAARVFAVDVGHGQFDETLRHDPRVVCMEGVNARTLTAEMFYAPVTLAVSDLSFISQALIYPAVMRTLAPGCEFVSLIKPQFEAGKGAVGKGGIVRDRTVHLAVIENLFRAAKAAALYPEALAVSPITGGDGNREYLALFRAGEVRVDASIDIRKIVFGT